MTLTDSDSSYRWRPDPGVPPRDFIGYGPNPPAIGWPGGARVAVSLCLNYEEGSERSIPAGDGVNEGRGEVLRTFPPGIRDLATESVFEYGSRAGIYRLLRLFDEFNMKCTVHAAAVALACNPEAAAWMNEAGHEFCSHGWRWTEQWELSREQERQRIRMALDLFEEIVGVRPVGWYSRWGPSIHTRELLVEEGFRYDSDAYNDDLPYLVDVGDKRHLIIPYSLHLNDGRFSTGHYGSPSAFVEYLKRTLDYLWLEGETVPRMMSVGLHPRWSGQPARASALREFLEYAVDKGNVWFARRDEIADWWLTHTAAGDG